MATVINYQTKIIERGYFFKKIFSKKKVHDSKKAISNRNKIPTDDFLHVI